MNKALLTTLLIAASARTASATQPLEEFLVKARSYSIANREVAAVRRQREAESDAALGRLLPSFSARGTYTHNQYETEVSVGGRSIVITPKNQLDAVLQLEVPIVDLASYYRYRSSQATARASAEQQAATDLDVERVVARSYYQHASAAALARSARLSVGAAEANLRDVEVRLSAGVATDLDRQRAIANVERARQDVADADLAIALSGRNLETLSGLTPTAAESFAPDELHAEAPLAEWLARVGSTPQERQAQALTEAVGYGKRAANATLLPTLTGSASERFSNSTGFAGESPTYAVQLTLGWRLDYGVVASARAQAAAAEVQQIRQESSRRAVADSIFEAYRRVEATIAKNRAARAQASAAARAAELARDRYGAGMATQLDVTQAQREAFLADAARIQADADLAYARASLRLAAGSPISPQRSP